MLAPETGKRSPNTQKDWQERAGGGGGGFIFPFFSPFSCVLVPRPSMAAEMVAGASRGLKL